MFHAYGLFVAWIFTFIEKRAESSHERMERILQELKNEVDTNYNMTNNDFARFVAKAAEAVMEGNQLDWNFLNSCGFVFAALTTIGFGNITPKTPLGQGITIIFCLIGIPLTMLALKSAGEIMACGIRFLVIKVETGVLKNDTPKHVKVKIFLSAVSLLIILFLLTSAFSVLIENWSYLKSLYAWFTTFTTIGFGDYIHLDSFARKAARGEIPNYRVVLYGLVSSFPYLMGLSLVSCILSCLVDSVDNVRNFRDRCTKFVQSLPSLVRRFLCQERLGYDVKTGENQTHASTREAGQEQ